MRKLVQFELKKIFTKRLTQAALAILLLLSLLFEISTYRNMYAYDGQSEEGTGSKAVAIDQAVAAKYGGILTDEKVRQMISDFASGIDFEALHGMNPAYLYLNATQSAAFARFSDLNGNWNGRTVSDVFGDGEVRVGYILGWLETSGNLSRLFLVLAIVIIVMTAPIFSGEYRGVDSMILTSRYGRTKCTAAKVLAGLLATLLVTAAVSAVNLLPALFFYGNDGLTCSILFAPSGYIEYYIPFNITCGTLLLYQILLAFTGSVCAAGIGFLLSALCKNQTAALAAAVAVYLLPVLLPVSQTNPLMRYFALLPPYHAQFVTLMSVEQMANGVLYAVWAVPTALILTTACCILSRRIFAKHQII